MDFDFTPEQNAIRDAARQFARTRLAPGYAEREKSERLEPGLVTEMGELGMIGSSLPEAYGGQGLSKVDAGIIVEEIAYADLSAAYIPILSGLNGEIILRHASPEIARKWLPRLCRGEITIALALTEPQVGSDAAHLRMKARLEGDHYILNGEKASITFSDQAEMGIIFARTSDVEDGAGGVSAFLVPLEQNGITRTRYDDLGEKAAGRGSIFFEDVAVPVKMRLGQEGQGFSQVMGGFDFSRALIGLLPLQSLLE